MRALILGLDSATFDVIDDMIDTGRLPNFAMIGRKGVRGEMVSTYPPRTAPAWVTLMTGQNPGKHGIFDFWFKESRGYDSFMANLVTSANYAGCTLFDVLSKNEKRVCSLFVPMTFPTWPVNGEMIAGPPFAPCSDGRLSFPSGIHKEFGVEHDVHLFPPSIKKGIDRRKTIDDLLMMEEARAEVALKLWDKGGYDCLMFVLESIDIVQHHLWRYFKSEVSNSFKDVIPKFYEKADQIIGELIKRSQGKDALFVVSDHGMASHPQMVFNTNAWLASKGWLDISRGKASIIMLCRLGRNLFHRILTERFYLELKKRIKTSNTSVAKGIRMSDQSNLAIQWDNTTAYRVQMQDPPLDGIMLNVQGRQPQGFVPEGSTEEIIALIKEELLKLKDPTDNASIFKAVYNREELYWGPRAHEMPDLVMEFKDGYKAGNGLLTDIFTPTPAVEISRLSGTHSPRGIFMAYGSPFAVGRKLDSINIADFAPIALYTMDQRVPSFMDGKIHRECFKEEFLDKHELDIGEMKITRVRDQTAYTDQDKSQIEEKLRNLGYL